MASCLDKERQLTLSIQCPQTSRASSFTITVPERRRICLPSNEIQLCLGMDNPSVFQNVKADSLQGLIKSNSRSDQQEGVRLLSDIFRASPDRRRECLYYLALGNYKLGNYAEAKRYNESLLELEPSNMQAQSLRQLVDDKVAKEGLMGVAIVGSLAVAAGVVGGMIFKNAQRRR